VVRRAQMRAALDHLSWNPNCRLMFIEASGLWATAWILRDAATLRFLVGVSARPPVRRPFPDIADHVVQAVSVRREDADRRSTLEAVVQKVLVWEAALPGIGHLPAARRELITPGELGILEPAPCRILPFRFGR